MAADRQGQAGRVAVLAVLVLLSVVGDARPEAEVLAGSASEAILVLPMNVVTEMPPELAAMSSVVWDDLTAYLQDRGRQLKTAKISDARDLWRASIRRIREGEDAASAGFDDALRLLVQALAQHAEFATVIVPSLMLREAPVRDRRAEWDGVSESVEFRAASPETRKLAILMRFEGLAPGASLHVVILDAQGRKLQEEIRGLELIAAVRVVEDPNEPFVYENRRDIFQDRDTIRERIAQVLAPFVPVVGAAPD